MLAAVLVALKQSGVESIADIHKDGPKELVIAASTPSGNTFLLPMALKNVLGLRLKIISGYAGSREAAMALDTSKRGRPDRRLLYKPDGSFDHIEADPDGTGQFVPLNP